jgi:predicted RNA-binding protein with PUA-like domain
VGDAILVYHTGKDRCVVGLARAAADARPDPKDPTGKLVVVDLEPVAAAKAPVSLAAIKADPRCADFALARLPRLSVMPVPDGAWRAIVAAAGLPDDAPAPRR